MSRILLDNSLVLKVTCPVGVGLFERFEGWMNLKQLFNCGPDVLLVIGSRIIA
jgi:hypothetical protein